MNFERRSFLTTLSVALITVPRFATAQPGKTFRVAYVAPSAGPTPVTESFRRTLAELGYVEGRNLRIEYRWMAGQESRYREVVGALRGAVDVVLVYGDISVAAARAITDVTPVVFVNAAEPVALHVVKSLARPGGNMTGITNAEAELIAKRLEALRHLLPNVTRFAVLVNPDNAASALIVQQAEGAARSLGVLTKRFDASKPEEFEPVAAQIAREGFGGVVVFEEPMYFPFRAKLVADLAKHRLPAAYPFRQFADDGGLLSYSPNLSDLAARGAAYVAKIFAGAKPSDLPVEQPTKFELVVNTKTAKAMGLTVPQVLLLRADHIIE